MKTKMCNIIRIEVLKNGVIVNVDNVVHGGKPDRYVFGSFKDLCGFFHDNIVDDRVVDAQGEEISGDPMDWASAEKLNEKSVNAYSASNKISSKEPVEVIVNGSLFGKEMDDAVDKLSNLSIKS